MRTLTCSLLVILNWGIAPLWAEGKTLHLRRTETQIRIDGEVDAAWAQADSVIDFVQHAPYHGQPPSHRTVAKVLTTGDVLYCLMTCADERANIQTKTGKLDDFGGDVVSIMLDTFGDRQTAYKFAVSAGGVRADCRLLDDARNRDYAWDGVWFSAARVSDEGFVVEMRIPYRTLQYDEELSAWGLDFDRWRPVNGEDVYWNAYAQNEGQRISRFGRLELGDFRPAVRGRGLEIYPVGLVRAQRLAADDRSLDPNAGLDLSYNPSQRLTFQLTANPDFAQIEADPFEFNITRYESHYDERRPFFTQGNEVFMASGKERNSGFYTPLELFYSRRIGSKLPDGSEIPLRLGTRAFGRLGPWEYGGFLAGTGEGDYRDGTENLVQPRALYGAARAKRQVLGNSSVGILGVARKSEDGDNAVLDLDGALRGSDWQLAYQLARSYRESVGSDNAASAGFRLQRPGYMVAARGRAIGRDFDVGAVGFVPWQGLSDLFVLAGPRWYFPAGRLRELTIGAGGSLTYEQADHYTDRALALVVNAGLRPQSGVEVDLTHGRSRDAGTTYTATQLNASWWTMASSWDVNAWGGVSRTYNFNRMYQGLYAWAGASGSWQVADVLEVGTSADIFIENDPDGRVEEVTWNARPYARLTPANDVSLYLYVDNLAQHSTGRLERVLGGALFSWQFMPKSWVYLAVNEVQERDPDTDGGLAVARPLLVRDRAAVLKVKLLYYL